MNLHTLFLFFKRNSMTNKYPLIIFLAILGFHNLLNVGAQTMIFPRAFAFAIDDIGWNNGGDLSGDQGPWRDGVTKHMTLNDYKAVVNVGKSVGVRTMGLFVLCEMDRQNVCAKYPSTTMYGKDWDNSANVNDEQVAIMKFVKENAANLEFGIHGVGHEYWPSKQQRVRAEWYNVADKVPWPEDSLRNHLKCFQEIMSQYGLNAENGQSFPESFVPGMYSYYWNPKGNYSLGKLLHEAGIKYANTSFPFIAAQSPPVGDNGGGFDHGVLAVNRTNYGNSWEKFGALPTTAIDNQKDDIIESHWPNWQAPDSATQAGVTDKWIAYYKSVQKNQYRYIAKNTEQLYSQWLYNKYTKVQENIQGTVEIDNTAMADEVYQNDLLGNMVLKLKLNAGIHVSSANIDTSMITSYFEDGGYAFIYLPRLEKQKYILNYVTGNTFIPQFVNNDGTYNIYNFHVDSSSVTINIKMYGTQIVKIKMEKPLSVESSNPNLTVNAINYDDNAGMVLLELSGRNIQGEKGSITIRRNKSGNSIPGKVSGLKFSLFPNPANNFFIIKATNVHGSFLGTISKLTGEKVFEKVITGSNNILEEKIDVSGLTTGFYIVRLMNKSGVGQQSLIVE